MADIQELIAKLKKRRLADQAAYLERLSLAEIHGIDYDENRRSTNLRLLRAYFNSNQEEFATLVDIRSRSEYSKIEIGSKLLPTVNARQIERNLGIPENWLDRDNSEALFLSLGEVALIGALRNTRTDSALPLANLIKTISSKP